MHFAAPPRLLLPNCLVALLLAVAAPAAVRAQEAKPDRFYELETKYLFGFTDGTDIGAEGEKEIELETTAAFQKRGGRYNSTEQEFEWEQVPSQYWGYELSAHAMSQQMFGVQGLDNRAQTTFSGLSWTPKWLVVGRGPGNPFGLSLSVQPEWDRIDGTSGAHSANFSFTTKLAVDTELMPNMLYAAVNLIYAPEYDRAIGDSGWSRASSYGATAALAYRVAPKVTMGGEVEYYRAYDGFALNAFSGAALYAGPTLHIQFNPKVFLSAAWSMEIAGHASGDPGRLDLTNFERQHANLKMGFEF
jgi:hypothetical protein